MTVSAIPVPIHSSSAAPEMLLKGRTAMVGCLTETAGVTGKPLVAGSNDWASIDSDVGTSRTPQTSTSLEVERAELTTINAGLP